MSSLPFYVVATMAVKGGTGKSLVAINIAARLAKRYRVALFDADIDSPNLSSMLGLKEKLTLDKDWKFVPVKWEKDGVRMGVVSMGLFDDGGLVTLYKQGEETRRIVNDMLGHTDWGSIDILVVDLPAGSGDELRAVLESVGGVMLGIILVTLPVTFDDCHRVIELCSRNGLRILGMVENMKGAVSSEGKKVVVEGDGREFEPFGVDGEEKKGGKGRTMRGVAESYGIKYFGGVPLVEGMYLKLMRGEPIIPAHSEKAFNEAVDTVSGSLTERQKEAVSAAPSPAIKKKRWWQFWKR